MKFICIICLALVLLSAAGAAAQDANYDAIIVRNDIPIEYVIAMPYASSHNIALLPVSQDTLTSQEQKQLSGFYQNGAERILLLGGTETALSDEVEQTIRNMGFDVDRKWGLVRENTAAIFAIDVWKESDTAVILNGSFEESYLVGTQTAMTLGCPILLVQDDTLPQATVKALETLGVTHTYIVGTSSLSEDVFAQLTEKGLEIFRIGEDISVHDVASEGGYGDMTIPWPLVLFAGIALGCAVFFIYTKRPVQKPPAEIPLFVLTEDERRVVDAIEAEGKELRQERLPELTTFSRPKVSRIVNDLESKQILIREKDGKTYKVKTAKKFIHER